MPEVLGQVEVLWKKLVKFKVACHLMSPRYMNSASPTHAGSEKPEGKDMGPFGGMPSVGGETCQVFLSSKRERENCHLEAPEGSHSSALTLA